MRNQEVKAVRGTTPSMGGNSHWKWLGMQDVKQGLGYRADYDTATKSQQKSYEQGRGIAVVMLSEWGQVIPWKRSERLVSALQRASLDPDIAEMVRVENVFHINTPRMGGAL